MKNIDITIKKIGDYTIFETAFDKLVSVNSTLFKNKVAQILKDDDKYLLLNLSSITEIDTEGLTSLIALQRMCFYKSVKMRLYGLSKSVADIIYQSRMNKIFDMCNEPFMMPPQNHVLERIKYNHP